MKRKGSTGRADMYRPSKEQLALTSAQPTDPSSPNRDPFSQQLSPSTKNPNLTVPVQTHTKVQPLAKYAVEPIDLAVSSASESTGPWYGDYSPTSHSQSTMSIFSTKQTSLHHINEPNVASRSYSNETHDSHSTIQRPQLPKSPGGSKLGSFFGWGGNISPASSTTTFSDKSFSPIPSPQASEPNLNLPDAAKIISARNIPTAIDVPKANAEVGSYFGSAYLQLPLATPTSPLQIEEMETELKEISAELASSIRREMDLEDLVERLQAEAQNPTSNAQKRTSDYFSDSGTSSVKYGETDSRQDELDRMLRKTEQEKAKMRLELTDKVQDERQRRKQLESQIRSLEEKASHVSTHHDVLCT